MGEWPIVTEIDQQSLFLLVERLDRDAALSGIEPKARSLHVQIEACKQLGTSWSIPTPKGSIADRVEKAHASLYRQEDVAVGGVFIGTGVYLDLFFTVYMPISYGTVKLDIKKCTDASEDQLRRIAYRPQDWQRFESQVYNIWDIGAARAPYHGFSKPTGKTGEFFELSIINCEAAGASARSGIRLNGSLHLALVSIELSLKAMIVDLIPDCSEKFLKDIGHDFAKAAQCVAASPKYKVMDLSDSLAELPGFVNSRYDEKRVSRLELGRILELSQEVLNRFVRGYSGKSLRDNS